MQQDPRTTYVALSLGRRHDSSLLLSFCTFICLLDSVVCNIICYDLDFPCPSSNWSILCCPSHRSIRLEQDYVVRLVLSTQNGEYVCMPQLPTVTYDPKMQLSIANEESESMEQCEVLLCGVY